MNKFLRVIDANINRASEGLRVLEDIFRLFYKNEKFVKEIKDIRHTIRETCSDIKYIQSRDILADSGKDSFTITEKNRQTLEDIYFANSKRVQESLRVLEEFFKIENVNKSFIFKKLRFDVYKLEEELFSVKYKLKKLLNSTNILLYTIVDSRFCLKNRIEACVEILQGGAKIIQLREKVLNDKKFTETAIKIKRLCEDFNALFIVNDRVDIAFASNADGVHLGQDDMPIEFAKDILGFNKIIGLSTHNLEQVKETSKINIDYIGFGPIFPTKSKENPDPVVGTARLRKIKEKYKNLPVCAIGGINFSNINKVIDVKPEMICVMSGITLEEDIKKAVEKYRRVINDTA
jgi:thiamine-phosphate pyrophosphorylase